MVALLPRPSYSDLASNLFGSSCDKPRRNVFARSAWSFHPDWPRTHHWHRRLLCARYDRPVRRTADERDELAPSHHSMTSSARASTVCGIVRPRTFAVIKFTARSILVGCSTGSSLGFAPRRILSTYSAERRNRSGKFGP